MNKKGYGVMSIKREVIEEIQKRAKEEKRTISVYLAELLEGKTTGKEGILSKVFGGNGLTKEDLDNALRGLREDIKTKAYAGAKEAIDEAIPH